MSMNKILSRFRSVLADIYHNMIPYQNIIAFESLPDLSDNTKAVFDEMIRRGMNKKYKMVWAVNGKKDSLPQIDNVVYYSQKDAQELRQFGKACVRARCLISCNGFLASYKRTQPSFYLTHGTGVKQVRGIFDAPDTITYFLAASPAVEEKQAYELGAPREKMFSLGFPRNDVLTAPGKNIGQFFQGDFEKIIVWYPTYRQHKIGFCTGAKNALPIIHNMDYAKQLNEAAKQCKVLLVVKPHFVQDIRYIQNSGLSHIRFIDDDFYVKNKISAYEFLGSSDALITDYSSVYYDYTLCDKPIAVIWEDIEEYKKKPGLIDHYEYYLAGAEKVYTIQELIGFVQRVSQGVDLLADDRRRIRDITNYAADGKNASRVVDFITEKARL